MPSPGSLVHGYQWGLSPPTQTLSGFISSNYETTGRNDLYSVAGWRSSAEIKAVSYNCSKKVVKLILIYQQGFFTPSKQVPSTVGRRDRKAGKKKEIIREPVLIHSCAISWNRNPKHKTKSQCCLLLCVSFKKGLLNEEYKATGSHCC